jgi:predicted kinase
VCSLAVPRFDDHMSTTSGRAVDMTPSLTVLSGRPGTGKTTLATAFARYVRACYLRVDAVETALQRTRVLVGIEGYAVIHELAVSNLLLGLDVVVDAVNPVPEARAGWRETAHRGRARLLHVETWLPDRLEHRRRVEGRTPDMRDQQVPSWEEVEDQTWVPWDTERDGPRALIETSDSREAFSTLVAVHERS